MWVKTGIVCCVCALGCAFGPTARNPVMAQGKPYVTSTDIETVVELDKPPGNVTQTPEGRVFFTFHPQADPDVHVAELTKTGHVLPFPDDAWQSPREGEPYFVAPLALRADDRGRLWVLDTGSTMGGAPSITAFDIESRQVEHRFDFPPELASKGSFLNDFWVDSFRDILYIADTSTYDSKPAIIVYEAEKKKGRRLLEDHPYVKAEHLQMVVGGSEVKGFLTSLEVAVDSIALSPDDETLYFGPMTGSKLYSIDTESLRNEALSEEALAKRVKVHGPKPNTDGIVADAYGNVYLTAIEHDGIWVSRRDGTLERVVEDRKVLSWPDGLHLANRTGYLYVTASQLHKVLATKSILGSAEMPKGKNPYRILRIPIPAVLAADSELSETPFDTDE